MREQLPLRESSGRSSAATPSALDKLVLHRLYLNTPLVKTRGVLTNSEETEDRLRLHHHLMEQLLLRFLKEEFSS